MRVGPVLAKGVPVLWPSGAVLLLPMQIFHVPGAGWLLRLGPNAFWFNKSGLLENIEHKIEPDMPATTRADLDEATEAARSLLRVAPDTAFFSADRPAYEYEVTPWQLVKPETEETEVGED